MKKKPAVPHGTAELHRNPRPLLRAALIVAVYLIAFIILDFITKQFAGLPGVVAWYPPAGLTYALLLVFGVPFTPAVTIALFLSSLFVYRLPQPLYLLLLWAFVISLIYNLAAAFLRKRIRFDWQLRKLRDVAWFVCTTVLVSALLAILSVSSSTLTSAIPLSEVPRAIFDWWIGETVGVLTVTPFLLIFVMPGLKRFVEGQPVRSPARRLFPPPTLSAIGQSASIALTLYLVFGAPALAKFHPLFLISLPLIWIALTRGFKGISVALLALNFGVVLALWLFRFDPAGLGEMEVLMIVNCIVGLLMGAVVTERKQAEEELVIANKELLFQNEEKEKRAAELIVANKELLFQNEEKEKRAAELVIANKELLFQNEEKEKRAAELSTVVEKLKRNEELLRETGTLAKVGGEEINLSDMTSNWTDEVFRIHELEPGRMPSVEEELDYYAPEARPIIQEAVNKAIATGEGWSLELPLITAKGKHLWIRSMGKPEMKDGKTSRILGVFQDITERKQSEQALVHSHELLNLTGQMGKIGGWELDLETQTLNWTDEVYRIHEVDSATKLNVAKAINFYAPEARPVITAAVQAGRDSGSPWDLDLPLITARGQHIWVRAQGAAERRDGKTVRLYGAFQEITERKQAEERILRQLEHLTALSGIDKVISANFDLKLSLSEILNHVTKELGVDAADILILNSGSQLLEYGAEHGFRTKAIRKAQIRLGEGYAGRAVLERQLIRIPDLREEPKSLSLTTRLMGEDFISYYGVPLITKGDVKGVMEIFHRAALEPDAEWFAFLNTLAGQAAIAVEIATLFESLQLSNSELFLAYDATIEGWSYALDLRDKETEGHTQRVTEMTLKLARTFGLSDLELVQVRWGALLHDIGKMGVPDEILLKPEPLTDKEWVAMKKHPSFAYEMLSPIRYLRLALEIPYCHHEKWDGSGYPRGLKGAQIPLVARIFAVVDVWDALTSDRPYRAAWPEEKVLDHIRSLSGTHFDPEVVKICLESGLLKGQKRL
jgi:putative nucleotidyltransferase with HDIG domain